MFYESRVITVISGPARRTAASHYLAEDGLPSDFARMIFCGAGILTLKLVCKVPPGVILNFPVDWIQQQIRPRQKTRDAGGNRHYYKEQGSADMRIVTPFQHNFNNCVDIIAVMYFWRK